MGKRTTDRATALHPSFSIELMRKFFDCCLYGRPYAIVDQEKEKFLIQSKFIRDLRCLFFIDS
jgi:hypothetical protein